MILAGVTAFDCSRRPTVLIVCGGWWIGWLSATIGRWVYPPPKKYREK
jgi:hypothetical protein